MAKYWESEYLELMYYIMEKGVEKNDRTGVGTRSVFGENMRIDLSLGFPAITTKKLNFKSVLAELLWFLEGSTDERRLSEIQHGKSRDELVGVRSIWTDNADNQGKAKGYLNTDTYKELGKIYSHQWRHFGQDSNFSGVDQISEVINSIKNDPDSRRHLVSAWNPKELGDMALPPCHYTFQFYVANGKLSCMFNMRSTDVFLGLPYNIASYALLTHMIAQVCDLEVGFLHYVGGDVHIYKNHFKQVTEQMSRDPFAAPLLKINPSVKNIFDFKMEDFELVDYNFHPAIKAPMAV